MYELHLQDGENIFACIRAAVEGGAPDGPWLSIRDGQPSVGGNSLHQAALMTVQEEPSTRFAAWSPHPLAEIGPVLRGLLDTRAANNARKRSAKMQGAR